MLIIKNEKGQSPIISVTGYSVYVTLPVRQAAVSEDCCEYACSRYVFKALIMPACSIYVSLSIKGETGPETDTWHEKTGILH